MRQLGAKLSDAEIDLLVKEADVDGDGQVDINEVSLHALQVQKSSSICFTSMKWCWTARCDSDEVAVALPGKFFRILSVSKITILQTSHIVDG